VGEKRAVHCGDWLALENMQILCKGDGGKLEEKWKSRQNNLRFIIGHTRWIILKRTRDGQYFR
jgi:hypothetical protein